MINLLKKPVTFEKVEFWGATAIYCFFVFRLLSQMISADDSQSPISILTAPLTDPYNNGDNILPELLRYTAFYAWFIVVDMVIIRSFVKARHVVLNIIFLLAVCVGCAFAIVVSDSWIKSFIYDQYPTELQAHAMLFRQNLSYLFWLLILIGFYTVVKQIIRIYLPALKYEAMGGKQLVTECASAFAIWCMLLFFFCIGRDVRTGLLWCFVLLFGIGIYWYLSSKTLPDTVSKKLELRDYLLKVLVVLLIAVPITMPVAFIVFRRLLVAFYIGIFEGLLGLAVVAPITWFLNQYRNNRNKELQGLKTELGQSSANLDFLRSQINPHFLFNALNTLYGTALQENAERTGSGIQKLGDMMRFMLQENMQEKISLTREVDYLNNYIDLQKLRTQLSPDILIQTEIDEEIKGLEIAPMLLIPFVENAFKHGISLREPSHIKISLQTRDKVLFFDVSNSIHPKGLNDPERDKSGIGLENVKQRLQLLYPGRHELTVRESAKEFFIHLTVTLAGKATS